MRRLELGPRRARAALTLTSLLLFFFVYARNAWLSDDVWITLRTVDNFVHGFGLTWNAYERVQAFTHPLWVFVLAAPYALFDDGFFTTLALSFVFSAGVLVLAWRRWRREPAKLLAFVAILVSSKAFIDYSSSGLENPLTHLLAALFFLTTFASGATPTLRSLTAAVLIAGFAYFNRADTVLAYAPTLLWLTWRTFRRSGLRVGWAWLVGTLPATGWTLFALLYFGFPVPNTAFAKLAGGHYHPPLLHPHALAYYTNSLRWDPATLPLVALALTVGLALAVRRRSVPLVTALVGVALLAVYALRIGGDYMSGRLFALPLLLSALVLIEALPARTSKALAVVAFVVGLAGPRSPFRANHVGAFMERDPTAIIDDHALHEYASLRSVLERKDYRAGRARQFDEPRATHAMIWGATGYHGYQRGPALRTIDNLALSDALLARLPPRHPEQGWGRGHLVRDIPDGYVMSVETGENRIVDPSLHEYYDKLLVITTGPLFTVERLKTIWRMNTGGYSHLVGEYEARRQRGR